MTSLLNSLIDNSLIYSLTLSWKLDSHFPSSMTLEPLNYSIRDWTTWLIGRLVVQHSFKTFGCISSEPIALSSFNLFSFFWTIFSCIKMSEIFAILLSISGTRHSLSLIKTYLNWSLTNSTFSLLLKHISLLGFYNGFIFALIFILLLTKFCNILEFSFKFMVSLNSFSLSQYFINSVVVFLYLLYASQFLCLAVIW